MANTRADNYKNRRIASAIRGGYVRLQLDPSTVCAKEKDKLKKGLTKIWEKSISTSCPLLCGTKLTPRRSAFCHDEALAVGGKHVASNIFLACSRCNKSQRTMPVEEFLRFRQVVIDHFGEERWKKVRGWLAGARH